MGLEKYFSYLSKIAAVEGDRCNGFHTHCLTFYMQFQGALPQLTVCIHLCTQTYGRTQNNTNPLILKVSLGSIHASFLLCS